MTHSWGTISTPLSNPEKQPSWAEYYESLVAKNMIRMLHYLCPWTDVMKASSDASHSEDGGGEGSSSGVQFSLQQNFGELEFDWEERTVRLRAMNENSDEPPLLMAKLSMDQLSGRSAMSSYHLTAEDFEYETASERHYLYDSDWVCINHRGRDTPVSHMIGHVSSAIVLVTLVPMPLLLPTFLVLLLIRRWAQKGDSPFCGSIDDKRLSKRGMFKSVPKAKLSKRMRLSKLIPSRYKTYVSMAKQSKRDLQNISRLKLTRQTNGVSVAQMIPFKAYDREMPQFS